MPQYAGVVYEGAEDDGRGYRAQDAYLHPLDAEGEGALIVAHDAQRARQCGHCAQEGDEHVAEGEADEEPEVVALAAAGRVGRLVRDRVRTAVRRTRQVHRRRPDAAAVSVDLNFRTNQT